MNKTSKHANDSEYIKPETMKKAEELKPDINDPRFWEHVGQSDTWLNESKYRKALKEWKSNQEENQ